MTLDLCSLRNGFRSIGNLALYLGLGSLWRSSILRFSQLRGASKRRLLSTEHGRDLRDWEKEVDNGICASLAATDEEGS